MLAELPRLWIPVSGFVVTPVLAWWHDAAPGASAASPPRWRRSPGCRSRELVDPANRLRVRHPSGWVGPAFQVRGMLVWGFTAGVLGDPAGDGRLGPAVAAGPGGRAAADRATPAPSAGTDAADETAVR